MSDWAHASVSQSMNSYLARIGGRVSWRDRTAIVRGLERFHRYLWLVQRDAPQTVLDREQVLIDRSLIELGCTERDLAELYPRYLMVALAREAQTAALGDDDLH